MKVAIFGAGTMGSGIAQVFSANGHTALLYATSTASAQRHKDKLAASLNKRVAKGKMTQEAADDLLSRILVEETEAAADADLVIYIGTVQLGKGFKEKDGAAVFAPTDSADGVTVGVDETHYGPEQDCTRSQAMTFLWRAKGSPEPESTESPFSDVTPEDYYSHCRRF